MSVRDDILNQKAQKGTKAWSEEHDTQNDYTQKAQKGTLQYVDSTAASNPAKEETVEATSKPTDTADNKKTLSYVDMYKMLNPKPDSEQLKKDAKRARLRNIFAALGDGISAIANLYFTTKGAPNMYDGKNTLSEKSQARYDKLMQDYKDNLDKYRLGQLKAEELDREWNHMTEREKVADEQFAQNQQRLKDESERQQNNWDKTFEENKRQFDENLARLKEQADKEFQEKKRVNNSTINRNNYFISGNKNGKDDKPKYMPFTSNDQKTKVSIREDVWESNWPYLFGIIVNEGYDMNDFLTKNLFENMDNKQKENFVKQHWEDSDMAKGYMKKMAELYPDEEFNKTYNSNNDSKELNWGSSNNNQDLDW